ncbi:MAG: hypothetical protein Q8L34_00575 [Candidatus Woesearchaeota archaeon]|nr:hypothetical protein [Candidatus Woesearchaeota archaeon]
MNTTQKIIGSTLLAIGFAGLCYDRYSRMDYVNVRNELQHQSQQGEISPAQVRNQYDKYFYERILISIGSLSIFALGSLVLVHGSKKSSQQSRIPTGSIDSKL